MAARIVVTEFVSLDGVMEAPGGEDFKYKAWTFEFDRGDDGNDFKLEETRSADALLLGRRTYESFAGAWPNREGEFADKFNAMPKYVVSTTLEDPDWTNTTVLGSGDATAQVRKLKDELDGELQVPGSQRLVQELIAADLVDQVNLMVFPVDPRHGQEGVRGDARPARPPAQGVEGRRRRRPRADLRARRLSRRANPQNGILPRPLRPLLPLLRIAFWLEVNGLLSQWPSFPGALLGGVGRGTCDLLAAPLRDGGRAAGRGRRAMSSRTQNPATMAMVMSPPYPTASPSQSVTSASSSPAIAGGATSTPARRRRGGRERRARRARRARR